MKIDYIKKLKKSLKKIINQNYSIESVDNHYYSSGRIALNEFEVVIARKKENNNFIQEKIYYSFEIDEEVDNSLILDFEFNTKKEILNFCNIFISHFNPLTFFQTLFNELNFMLTYAYNKQIPKEIYPLKIDDIIDNFYFDRDHFLFRLEDEMSGLYIKLDFKLDIENSEIYYNANCSIKLPDTAKNIKLSNIGISEDTKNIFFEHVSHQLNRPLNSIKLSDHKLLSMINIR